MNRAERRALRKQEAMRLKPSPGMREFWASLTALRDAQIVIAVLPDESTVVVKGLAILEEIIATGETRDCKVMYFPAPSVDFAKAMEITLAGSMGVLN
ncbi:hypothetical protein [Roseomonas chloroacetimidivorans]|uniref:hypothetical protein n=1 Tax=Roseomonas chloroacetimidivorans TaxID=1766656 RepID=UPI003C739B14